jgi:exo-beta-1,3-glucanase (GH17 family)
VINAIKGGDFKKAGDEVLNLPSKGTTYGKANPTRANAIKSSLQSPKPPDPCE